MEFKRGPYGFTRYFIAALKGLMVGLERADRAVQTLMI